MNYAKIQILCLMASICLVQGTVQAVETASKTLVIMPQLNQPHTTSTPSIPARSEKMAASNPRRACYDQVYNAAKAAREGQSSLTGHHYIDMYDTIFDKCLENRSENLIFKKSDAKAVTDCLNGSVAIATEKNDAATREFLVQQVVHKKLDKGGPTVSFTFFNADNAFWGAIKRGTFGLTAGSVLGLTASVAYNRGIDSGRSETHTIERSGFNSNPLTWFTRIVTTTKSSNSQQQNRADIQQTIKNSAIAGGILGALAGIPCGIKASWDF